jgi:hypothetical protein
MTSIDLQEDERQLVLMALAVLSLTFPGWDDAVNRIALRIDNDKGGRAELFDEMRKLRADVVRPLHERDQRCDRRPSADLFEDFDTAGLRVVEAMLPVIETIPGITPDEIARTRSLLVYEAKAFVGGFLSRATTRIIDNIEKDLG